MTTDAAQIGELFAWVPPWGFALGYFLLVIVIALVLQSILNRLVKRTSAGSASGLGPFFVRTKNVARFAFAILAAALALPLAPLEVGTEELARSILIASLVLLLGWVAVIASHIAADRYVSIFQLGAEDNLSARKAVTQFKILRRAADTLIVVVTVSLALMIFPTVRQYGISLFASAGIIGVVIGLAAQPTIGNLLAGIQLAITQPIRIDDVLIVENEWGRVEEINSTYVVIRIWDLRRLIVPLTYFLQRPFENWTRTSASILGSVFFYVDYRMPVDSIRTKLDEIVKNSELWDGEVLSVQVTDCKESTMEVRALISAADSSNAWDLRCLVREKMLAYLQQEHPDALPRQRGEFSVSMQPHTSTETS